MSVQDDVVSGVREGSDGTLDALALFDASSGDRETGVDTLVRQQFANRSKSASVNSYSTWNRRVSSDTSSSRRRRRARYGFSSRRRTAGIETRQPRRPSLK